MTEHYWDDCQLCGRTVICGVCGNNTCNGGYGEVDGETCTACESAYEMMYAGEDTPTHEGEQ